MKRFQGTVTRPIHFVGVGLHSGKLVNMLVSPQNADTGILFAREGMPGPPILACPANVSATTLCTTIGQAPHSIATIEHLMAAFFGLGIDNALVTVNSAEIPILDGSAAPYVDKLNAAGVQIQPVMKPLLIPPVPFEISEKDQYIRYDPPTSETNLELKVNCSIDFPSLAIGRQSFAIQFGQEEFLKICEARTFCHINSVNLMRSQGLALGGSLDNAVVVDDNHVLNTEGLRFSDEFVRHKLLDFFGDLALLPGLLVGNVTLHKAGHCLHARFAKKVLSLLQNQSTPTTSHKDKNVWTRAALG